MKVRAAFPPTAPRGWLRLAALAALLAAPGRAETLSLEDCLREAAAHNPVIIEQRCAIEQALGTRLTLHARPLPRFGISGIFGRQSSEKNEGLTLPGEAKLQPAQTIAIGSEALYQPLFDAAIPASWRRGNLEVTVAKENLYVAATAQLYAARVQFYTALFARDYGAVLKSIEQRELSNIAIQRDLLKAGLAGRQGLLQAQVQEANVTPQIAGLGANYRSAVVALLQILGRELGPGGPDPVDRITLKGSLEEAGNFSFDLAGATAAALARRPDLLQLRDLSRALGEDARTIRAGYYPLVNLFVTGDLVPSTIVSISRPNSTRAGDNTQVSEARPGANYSWTVIDLGAVRGAAQQYDKIREQFEINLHRLERNIPSDLAQVRASHETALARSAALEANVKTAEETLNIVESSVAQGTGSQLEYIDAENSLLSTRAGLVASRFQAALAHADYDRDIGGYVGFVPVAQPPSPRPGAGK